MAVIEQGEHFVVKRGVEYYPGAFAQMIGVGDASSEPEVRYDNSFRGCLFLADEVCEPFVACTCMFARGWPEVGSASSFNMDEVELWPVTQAYADAMLADHAKQETPNAT